MSKKKIVPRASRKLRGFLDRVFCGVFARFFTRAFGPRETRRVLVWGPPIATGSMLARISAGSLRMANCPHVRNSFYKLFTPIKCAFPSMGTSSTQIFKKKLSKLLSKVSQAKIGMSQGV